MSEKSPELPTLGRDPQPLTLEYVLTEVKRILDAERPAAIVPIRDERPLAA